MLNRVEIIGNLGAVKQRPSGGNVVTLRLAITRRWRDCNKNIDQLVDSMTELKKNLLKLREKWGLVVVEVDNVQLTTYKLDSYDRRRIL